MILSIIIPCFNEEKTILEILNKVNTQKKFFNIQIIISDDGSTDNSIEIIRMLSKKDPRKLIFKEKIRQRNS